jgi:hypothetical protein
MECLWVYNTFTESVRFAHIWNGKVSFLDTPANLIFFVAETMFE